eukprot:11209129-Alexandrium_andersonii.AAC.1
MSASLVGSEMCIRDRRARPSLMAPATPIAQRKHRLRIPVRARCLPPVTLPLARWPPARRWARERTCK